MKVLIARDHDEQKEVRLRDKNEYFTKVVTNSADQLRYLEGLPFREVWITSDVLTMGLNSDLFERIHSTLVRMSVDPSKGFRIFFI